MLGSDIKQDGHNLAAGKRTLGQSPSTLKIAGINIDQDKLKMKMKSHMDNKLMVVDEMDK